MKAILKKTPFERQALFHWQAFQLSFRQLRQTLMPTWMTAAVIGIALALPTVFFVLLQNVSVVAQSLEKGTQISLFLTPLPADALHTLTTTIKQRSDVANVVYISPEEGLHELEVEGGLSNVLDQLASNPLPPVIQVYPAEGLNTPEKVEHLLNALKAMPGVESAKLDMLWIKRLHALLNWGERAVAALSSLLALAVILVIHHTIQLSTQNRQKEISVLMLIGATRAFIRRPFLYTGMFYGFLGGLLAWFFVEMFIFWLSFSTEKVVELYHTHFELSGLDFFGSMELMLLSLFLGWLGSWFAVNKVSKEI